MERKAVVAHPADNVATVVETVSAGDRVSAMIGEETVTVTALEAIPKFHKIALDGVNAGGRVVKYGETIGEASSGIAAGAYVHVHNVESNRGRGDKK